MKRSAKLKVALVKPKRVSVSCCTCTPETCGCKQRKLDKNRESDKVVGK